MCANFYDKNRRAVEATKSIATSVENAIRVDNGAWVLPFHLSFARAEFFVRYAESFPGQVNSKMYRELPNFTVQQLPQGIARNTRFQFVGHVCVDHLAEQDALMELKQGGWPVDQFKKIMKHPYGKNIP